jgi:hypothetical protein
MEKYVIFYSTDAKTGKTTETKHYLTHEEIAEFKAQQMKSNKQQAKALLEQSDWATRPSISDLAISNPYLANQADFFNYQNALRQIVFNPPDIEIEFPLSPEEQWMSVKE